MRGTQICDCKMDFKNRMQNSPLFSNLDYFAVMLKKKKFGKFVVMLKTNWKNYFIEILCILQASFSFAKHFAWHAARVACAHTNTITK